MNFCSNCGYILDSMDIICPSCLNSELLASSEKNEKNSIKISSSLPKNNNKYLLAKMVVSKGGTDGREFPIYKNIAYIGRWDPNLNSHPEIDLSDEDVLAKVSRKHAKITKKEEGFYLEDLGSKNGTYLNREFKLVQGVEYSLKNEDEIIIGNIYFKFSIVAN